MPSTLAKLSYGKKAFTASAIFAICLLMVYFRNSRHFLQYDDATSQLPLSSHDDHESAGVESPQADSEQVTSAPTMENHACSVTKVSMLYGAHRFPQLENALDLHRQHSERWGCGFVSLEYDLVPRKLYSKHYFLMSTILQELAKPVERRRQWLMWVDADSMPINPALSPEIFLPPDTDNLRDIYALVTADHNGLNDGMFYLRVHPLSVDLLTLTAAYPLVHPDEDLGWFGEQAAMANVIRALRSVPDTPASKIAWLPRTWFNTYQFETGYEGNPGDMMVHFAGLAETRLMHMSNWLVELQNNPAKWELPLAQTKYTNTIPKFWAEFAANLTQQT